MEAISLNTRQTKKPWLDCDLSTVDGFMEFMQKRSEARIETCRRKNNDYAAPDAHNDDPMKVFRNFTTVEELGACTTEQGFFTRMTDKYMRIINLMSPGHKQMVSDEAIDDTIMDLQNYLDLLAGYLQHKNHLEAPTYAEAQLELGRNSKIDPKLLAKNLCALIDDGWTPDASQTKDIGRLVSRLLEKMHEQDHIPSPSNIRSIIR